MAVEQRQQQSSSSAPAASASSASSASNAASASNTGSASNAASSATGTITSAASATASASTQFGITGGPGYNPSAVVNTTVAANGPPGEIVFTEPPPQSTSYYKIASGEYVTFGWNFTNVVFPPTSLTVSAACENSNTYPVGPSNGVIPGDAQSVVWYPYGYQTANPSLPLAMVSCTLQVFASGGPSAIPTPGFLAPNDELIFALYTPQPYTPLSSGWQCTGCGGALGQFQAHPASIALVVTLFIVFLSGFTTLRRVAD